MATASKTVCCGVCGKEKDILSRCTRCKRVFYCSRNCQIKDWATHKITCQPLTKAGSHICSSVAQQPNQAVSQADLSGVSSEKQPQSKINASTSTRDVQVRSFPLGDQGQDCTKQIWTDKGIWQDENMKECSTAVTVSAYQVCAKGNEDQNLQTISYSKTNLHQPAEDLRQKRTELDDSSTEEWRANHSDRSTEDMNKKLTITVRANKAKHKISFPMSWTGEELLEHVSGVVQIPASKLKLIHRGKVVTSEVLAEAARSNFKVFQAIGEMAESEEGIEPRDIEVLLQQLNVERNEAIRALRQTGDLIDAIFLLGNKQ